MSPIVPLGTAFVCTGLQNERFNHHVVESVDEHGGQSPSGRVLCRVAPAEACNSEPTQVPIRLRNLRRLNPGGEISEGLLLTGNVSAADVAPALYQLCRRAAARPGPDGPAALTVLPDVLLRHVLSFLRIQPATGKDLRVVAASSEAHPNWLYSFRKECVLEPGIGSCWISKAENFHQGKGCEWLTFALDGDNPQPRRRRVRCVQVRIPVSGPLAVEVFHLEASENRDGGFKRVTPDLRMIGGVIDTHPIETFLIPEPIEASFVRFVCTKNMLGDQDPSAQSVGFWEVCLF